MQVIEVNGQKRARQQVSTPHLWEGILFYLTVMALDQPQLFFAYESLLPPLDQLIPIPSTRPEAPLDLNEWRQSMNDSESQTSQSSESGCFITTRSKLSVSSQYPLGPPSFIFLFLWGLKREVRKRKKRLQAIVSKA